MPNKNSKVKIQKSKLNGFTLVELLIVLVILAILTTIGLVAFRNVPRDTRDNKRKADIDAIAKAYESTYTSGTGVYLVLTGANFTSGQFPTPPEGGSYDGLLTANGTSFTVCARLEAHTGGACAATSTTCYCQSNAF